MNSIPKKLFLISAITGTSYLAYKSLDTLSTPYVPISEDEVIKYWLDAEAGDVNSQFYSSYQHAISRCGDIQLDNPDLRNSELNAIRHNVFWEVRGNFSLWKPIHEKTSWYKTKLLILPWDSHRIVAPYPPRENDPRNQSPNMGHLILWGHFAGDNLIVLEGNHRWNCHYKSRWYPYLLNVVVGHSEDGHHILHEHAFDCHICKENKKEKKDPASRFPPSIIRITDFIR